MSSIIKSFSEIWADEQSVSLGDWNVETVLNEECSSYIIYNSKMSEALLVDPKLEDEDSYRSIIATLSNYTWIGVIDTHTHADHISIAAKMAESLNAPLIMHEKAVSRKVNLRVSKRTSIQTKSGVLDLILTPGHTPDSITALWGPFAITGDTVFHADVGRDDLPGGDAEAHFDSIQLLCKIVKPGAVMLPGHDFKGGRASLWSTQLKINTSLTQRREDFVGEAKAFEASAPKNFKKALVENFK